jgi:catechol 2,3-dioxygenase-like lactoylglutathione lyase family enzyme
MYTIKTANVTVMVKNMDKSIDFYTSLGLELKQRWNNHYAQVAAPGVIIGLHPAKETNNPKLQFPLVSESTLW